MKTTVPESLPAAYKELASKLSVDKMLFDVRKAIASSLSRPGLINTDNTQSISNALIKASDKDGALNVYEAYSKVIGQSYLQTLMKAPQGSSELLDSLLHAFSDSFSFKAAIDNPFKIELKVSLATALWQVQRNFLMWVDTGKDGFKKGSHLDNIGQIKYMNTSARLHLGAGILVATESMSAIFQHYVEQN